MKTTRILLAAAIVLGVGLVERADAVLITQGNLVVVQVGDGTAALTGSATAASLKEFTTAGAPVQTIALPTVSGGGNNPLTLAGNSTSEGFLQISTNSQYLTLAGYGAIPGTATPNTATAATVARVVGRVEISSGNVNTTTALGDAYNGSNVRSAITTNGTDIWTGGNAGSGQGATGGVKYTTLGSTTSTRVNTATGTGSNSRVVNISDGQLYVSASSTPRLAVQQIGTGTPMVAGSSETTLAGMPITGSHSTYDFWFRDANTVYLADDGSVANGGGIQKWTLAAGTWSLQYTLLNNGATNSAVRGLAGYVDGSGNAVLFGTTGSTLITVTDAGVDNDVATLLVTAPTNTAFRGIEFIPVAVPEASAFVFGGLICGAACLWQFRQRRRLAEAKI